MPTTKRSGRTDDDHVTSEAAEQAAEQADKETMATAPDVPSPVQASSAHTPAGATATLRLPFVSATFTRSSANPGAPSPLGAIAGVGQAAVDAAASVVASVPRQRLVFYTGVAALGIAGVVEWPVAALVATGTYVASRARRGESSPAGAADRETSTPAAAI